MLENLRGIETGTLIDDMVEDINVKFGLTFETYIENNFKDTTKYITIGMNLHGRYDTDKILRVLYDYLNFNMERNEKCWVEILGVNEICPVLGVEFDIELEIN